MIDESHANMNGMRKITSYIGKYLDEVNGITDHRKEPAYQNWNEKVNEWQAREKQRFLETDLYLGLSMIQNLDADAIVFMRGNSQALQDIMVQELMMQLSGAAGVTEAAKCGGPYLLIKNSSDENMPIQEFAGEQQIEFFESILGDTEYIGVKEFGAIYADGNLEHNYLNMEEHYTAEVQILILNQEGEVMHHLIYNPNWKRMVEVQ